MISQQTLERVQACGGFLEGVLHIFSPCKIPSPFLLVVALIRSINGLESGIIKRLAWLGVVHRNQTDLDLEKFTEGFTHSRGELGSTIRYNVLHYAKVLKHMKVAYEEE